jgi:hypothetical protein
MEELSQEDTAERMKFWYERAVDEQKKELREYKKKLKAQKDQAQLPHKVESVEAISSEQESQDKTEILEPISA